MNELERNFIKWIRESEDPEKALQIATEVVQQRISQMTLSCNE